MRLLITSCIDLLDLIDLGCTPTDREAIADVRVFTPDMPFVRNKVLILRDYYSGSGEYIRSLSKHNTIINRNKKYEDYPVKKYSLSSDQLISTTDILESTSDFITDPDAKVILLDDLLITNRRIYENES